MSTHTYSNKTIAKIHKSTIKILKRWSKDKEIQDASRSCNDLDSFWKFYAEDICSDVFYDIQDTMYSYSYFDNADDPSTPEYALYIEFMEICKEAFYANATSILQLVATTETSLTSIIDQVAQLSVADKKTLIVELLKTI